MKKKCLSIYCSILLVFCQVFLFNTQVSAISEVTENSITTRCDSIKNNLKNVQKADAKARVFLGGYYETVLSKFITPLNMRLVENNLSTADLVENQNKFAETKNIFSKDYIKYQQSLEELFAIDCKAAPEDFYNKLTTVRERRKTVEQDTLQIRALLSSHVRLVKNLRTKL